MKKTNLYGYNKNLHPIYNEQENTNLASFYGDIKHFEICYNFLLRQGFLNRKYSNHLDIGGAQGHISFLLNILNIVENSTSLDTRKFDYNVINHFFIYYKFVIRKTFSKIFKNIYFAGKTGYVDKSSIYCNLPLFVSKIPKIKMINTNIYNINEKYDLITSIASLEHFDFDRIFQKISSILNKNGIFIIMVDYWWYTLNSTGIFSKKPYATQMLTYNELEREIKKNNPTVSDNLFKYYNYFHLGTKRPIVDDYIKKAKKCGLKFQSSQRLVPSDRIETRVSNKASPNKLHSKELNRILSSISRFKDGVTIEDLHTMYVLMIFQK